MLTSYSTSKKDRITALLAKRKQVSFNEYLAALVESGASPNLIMGHIVKDTSIYVSVTTVRKWISDLPVSPAASD